MCGSAESEHPRLTNGEIIFEEFQPMSSQSINVSDRHTDGHCSDSRGKIQTRVQWHTYIGNSTWGIKWSRNWRRRRRQVDLKGQDRGPDCLYLYAVISKTVRGRGLVPTDHHYEMGYGESNSHMTNDVM